MSPQGHDLHWLVSAGGGWSLVIAAGPHVSHGFTPYDFAAFPGLELKHS